MCKHEAQYSLFPSTLHRSWFLRKPHSQNLSKDLPTNCPADGEAWHGQSCLVFICWWYIGKKTATMQQSTWVGCQVDYGTLVCFIPQLFQMRPPRKDRIMLNHGMRPRIFHVIILLSLANDNLWQPTRTPEVFDTRALPEPRMRHAMHSHCISP